ncbi:hypothetical protein IFU30_11010 [Plantibacter sp. CFBP 8798]|uniref:terminase large subunit domain-containing protein n=1 Tax=Plantibacter sp. CFBP 8798 TaxID=2775268 RepID=UPI0017857384|nr:terminase large subunit [Plantibacter sp. CFBP 8798]MBD8466797.1 hypothetical protein [Plantibacter sp. CFBP 8798]
MPETLASWHPTRFSAPLSEDFPSHGDWLLKLVDLVWRLPNGKMLQLDAWQRWLIRAALEVYPEGHPRAGELRYRQVLISMGRQNGKSILGAIFALYGLIREAGALVIGIASSAEQARIIYARLLFVIRRDSSLSKRFERLTDTRGISSKDGGRYELKASKSAAVQGLDLSTGLVDELHITKPELWSDMVNGTRARYNGIVIGLTTAGDDNSTLLKHLYQSADEAGERFGYFIWESESDSIPEDDETFGTYLCQANPSVACGRIDLATVINDVRGQPDSDILRYGFNRFVAASAVFISAALWLRCQRASTEEMPKGRPVFAIDRDPDWRYATIVAAVKDERGVIWTEVVASITNPTLGQLADVAAQLQAHSPLSFFMDGYSLKDLGAELKKRGLPVRLGTQGDAINAASTLFSKIKQRRIRHDNAPLLALQMPRTIRKNKGDAYRISRKDSSIEIDAVIAESLAVLGAETITEQPLQIF